MKARLGTKTIAVILCAAMLALALSCGAGVALLAGYGYLAGAESYVEMDTATTAGSMRGSPWGCCSLGCCWRICALRRAGPPALRSFALGD